MRVSKSFFTVLLLLALGLFASGQQYNNWFFGDRAGLSFNAHINPAIPFPVNGGRLSTYEGNSTISDENGNLLFYSDGVNIYNRHHRLMPAGVGLSGDISSFQGVIILQVPKNDSLFYVFTSDAIENNFANGYRYSVVNMRLDSGRGDVIVRNQLLHPSATERLTAAKHANGVDTWIITNDKNSNTFRTWLLNCNGLHPTAVVSSVGEILNYPTFNMGSLKVSPDGKRLCQTVFTDDKPNFFQLFDFDNQTGVIRNPKKVVLEDSYIVSADFSPNSRLLYLTQNFTRILFQVEAGLPTAAAIEASVVKIPTTRGNWGIQLAPDKKIYITNFSTSLAVISQPDQKGLACDYKDDAVALNGQGLLALPFVLHEPRSDSNYFTYSSDNNCSGLVRFSAHTALAPPVQWEWDFGDGTTSSLQNPVHSFTPANKIYLVKLRILSPTICGYVFKSQNVSPTGVQVKADFEFSVKCDSNTVRFTDRSLFADSMGYLWTFGDGQSSTEKNPVHRYTAAGNYTIKLKVTGIGPCASDSMQKTIGLEFVQVNASPDQTILEGKTAALNATGSGISYEWSPATGLSNPKIANPVASPVDDITYVVTATNAVGCKNRDSVRIHVQKLSDIFVPSAFSPNDDGLNDQLRAFITSSYELEEFSIFNRWGQKVFFTRQKGIGWDGEVNKVPQATGVFMWLIRAKDPQGRVITKKGSFILIR